MKEILFTLICLMTLLPLSGQNISIIYPDCDINKEFSDIKDIGFNYIDPHFDLTDKMAVAAFRVIIDKKGKNSFIPTFISLQYISNAFEANSFAIDKVSFDKESNKYITEIRAFTLSEDELDLNYSFIETNTIILFGDLNTDNPEKEKTCKINKEKIKIAPHSFLRIENEPGSKTNISTGGLLGSSVEIVNNEISPIQCFTLGGTTIRPAGGGVSFGVGNRGGAIGGGIGFNINTGSINPLDTNCGLFIMTILHSIKTDTIE